MDEPFGRELRRLMLAREMTTPNGNPAWADLGRALTRVGYETLRKALTGERKASSALIEDVATVLGVPATHFAEYRLHLARRDFDPQAVGFRRAAANATTWLSSTATAEPGDE